ncbi:RCC1 domain-containing protein [Oxalobacter formigenes]|uniref:RCC1 domain-containing protein n=1 Tax=Oxalobacter formigenes TaxID=847 RepID=UPI00241E98F3|nr:hypothetical protein [Oxalobacter formigenes]
MRLARFLLTILVSLCTIFFLSSPAQASDAPAKRIDAGNASSVYIDSAGKLWASRDTFYYEGEKNRPAMIAKNVIAVSTSQGESTVYFITRDHTLWGYGSGTYGQLGKEKDFSPTPEPLLKNIVFIDAGHDTPFAIDEKGQLWTWGNDNPAKGKSTLIQASVPAFPAGPVKMADNIVQVSSSLSHTLALAKDGTLLAWGDNPGGEIGDGTITNRTHPVTVDISTLNGRKIVKITTRFGESFALTDDGTLWNWGQSYTIPAEPGAGFPRLKPEKITYLDNVADVALGWGHILVLKKDKTVWIAGTGKMLNRDMEYEKIMYEERQTFLSMHGGKPDEETGDDDSLNDTSDDRFREIVHRWHSPRKIATNIAEITSGQNHILLRKTNGTVIGCGANFAGELGIPNKGKQVYFTFVTLPVPR